MRPFIFSLFLAATLWGQGAGGVQFRDWSAPAANTKSRIACGELRSLTSIELSVISASVMGATPDAPNGAFTASNGGRRRAGGAAWPASAGSGSARASTNAPEPNFCSG